MAWRRKDRVPPVAGGRIDTILGPNTNYDGAIRSDGNIRIDGIFCGRVETAGNVIIGPTARVQADIEAGVVQVWGQIRGLIKTRGRLEIMPDGRVWGDVDVNSLLVDEGGMLRGQCLMGGEVVEDMVMPEPSPSPAISIVTADASESTPAPAEEDDDSSDRKSVV
jgi:cytoskeletal protein CcmA (bactofilin family)